MSFPHKLIKDKNFATDKLHKLAEKFKSPKLLELVIRHPNCNQDTVNVIFSKLRGFEKLKFANIVFEKGLNISDQIAFDITVASYARYVDDETVMNSRILDQTIKYLLSKEEAENYATLETVLDEIKDKDLCDSINHIVEKSPFITHDIVLNELAKKVHAPDDLCEYLNIDSNEDRIMEVFNRVNLGLNNLMYLILSFNNEAISRNMYNKIMQTIVKKAKLQVIA